MMSHYKMNKLSGRMEAIRKVAKQTVKYSIILGIGLGVSAAFWAVAFGVLWFNSHLVLFRTPVVFQNPVVIQEVTKLSIQTPTYTPTPTIKKSYTKKNGEIVVDLTK